MGIKLLIADDEDVVRNGITKYIQLHTDRYKKFMVQKTDRKHWTLFFVTDRTLCCLMYRCQ